MPRGVRGKHRLRKPKVTTSQANESPAKTVYEKPKEATSAGPLSSPSRDPVVRKTPKLRNPGQAKSAQRIQTASAGGDLKKVPPEVINNLKALFLDLYVEKYRANGGTQEEELREEGGDEELGEEEGDEDESEEQGDEDESEEQGDEDESEVEEGDEDESEEEGDEDEWEDV